MVLTIIIFILILAVLILSHEFGHFISAKKMGMKVEEFGFGFPPRLFGIKKGETLYSINLIPLGGFVRIYGENREEAEKKSLQNNKKAENKKKVKNNTNAKRAFYAKPVWKRAIVISMGVIMNFLLAMLILAIVNWIGVPTIIENSAIASNAKDIKIQIIDTAKGSPAEKVGLTTGDAIIGLSAKENKIKVKEIDDIQKFIARHSGEKITLTVLRGKNIFKTELVPRMSPPKGEGPIGIVLAKTGIVRYPWYKAIWRGIKSTGEMTVIFVKGFYKLFKTLLLKGALIGELAGPVGIAAMTSQATKLGLVYILQFVAIISINLAIINILPFPALDGGRLLFLAIEKIKGSPVKAKIEEAVNGIGFALLILLMILVTFRDITRLF